eukprot:95421_1
MSEDFRLQLIPSSTGTKRLNWTKISNTLEKYLFFPIKIEAKHKRTLTKLFTDYCEKNEKIDTEYFVTHLCQAYYSDNDKVYMFYNVLSEQLNYSLDKRHQFYHILLHQYIKLSELNQYNISQILY